MMRNLVIAFLVLIFWSCEKEELPADSIGSPAFQSELQVGGETISFVAGENGNTLFGEVSDVDTLITFSSGYANSTCEGCGPAISLSISNPPEFNWDGNTNWIEALQQWDLAFEAESDISTELFVNVESGNPFAFGFWIVNNQLPDTSATNSALIEIPSPGAYEILYEDSAGSCINGPVNTLTWDGVSAPCYASILMVDEGLYQVFPSAAYTGSEFFSWTLDGVPLGVGNAMEVFEEGTLCATSIDATGCEIETCIELTGTPLNCAGNALIVSDSLITTITTPNIGLAEIEYVSPNGVTFNTVGDQSGSQIGILAIEPFEETAQPGVPYLSVQYGVSCNLYSAEGEQTTMNGQINLAFPLPE